MNQKIIEAARPVVADFSYIDLFASAPAEGTKEVLRQEQENADIQAISSTAFCREPAEVGVDCALLATAEVGAYPRIILGDGSDASVLIDGDG